MIAQDEARYGTRVASNTRVPATREELDDALGLAVHGAENRNADLDANDEDAMPGLEEIREEDMDGDVEIEEMGNIASTM